MRNIGNFYALARAQVDRTLGGECLDMVLASILPADYHPTSKSRVRRVMDSLPLDQHRLFAAACHWFGGKDPELLVGVFDKPDMMELRARLVDSGGIVAPADAPCRTVHWATVLRRMTVASTHTARIREAVLNVLPGRVPDYIADTRHVGPGDNWVHVDQTAALGLGWVGYDVGAPAGEEEAAALINEILVHEPVHWLNPVLVDAWTVDSVVSWAAVCWHYVQARRVKS